MSDRPMLRIIAYDVVSNRRRRKIAELLESHACRVQDSVFEARLTHEAARRLLDQLRAHAGNEDSIRLYTVPDAMLDRCATHGGPAIDGAGRYWLL